MFRQYDHHVQTNTVVGPGADAAVLRVKGSATGIALTVDGNGRYCYLDPYEGGKIAVAEALPQPVRRRRRAGRADRLPELRQPRAAGDLPPATGVHPRYGRGEPRLRRARRSAGT